MYKLISVNNETTKGVRQIGNTNHFNYDGSVFRFGDIRSSTVKSILVDDLTMTVQTRNSIYTFIKEYPNDTQ